MSKTRTLLIAFALLVLPAMAFAQAEPPKWGYIEAGFIDFDPDNGASDDGAYALTSFSLFKHFHIVAEYDDIGNYTFWNAGVGWHGLLGEKADLFAQVMWANIDVEDSDISENGYDVQAGFRWKLVKWFELLGQANWADYGGDVDSETTYEAGGTFLFFGDKMGVGAKYEMGDANTLRAYFRFNWGR